jgi:hypothetical protein
MARKYAAKRLDPQARAWLEAAIAQDRYTLAELVAELQARFGETLSKSAIHRYGREIAERAQAAMARVEATARVAREIVAASPDEADEQSAATIRLVQSALFDALLKVQEAEGEETAERIKLLSQAARAIADASRASIGQKKWAEEVKTKLDAIEREAGKAGRTLDAETLKAVREGLYGG